MHARTKRYPLLALVMALFLATGCAFLPWWPDDTAIAQTSGVPYPIVDTAQELTYDDSSVIAAPTESQRFYGQDAQVDGNQPSYVADGDGTVTDLVTGLMWTQGYYGKMSQSQAAAYAESFELAGYSDWRLPTIKELYSLIDFSGEDVDPMSSSASNPFIDTRYFDFAYGDTSAGERIIDSQWATTSIYTGDSEFAGGSRLMFGVNFADGRIKGYPVQGSFYVRLVRGNTAYGENDLIDNGDGTITDLATGLMWSQDDSGTGLNWEDALAYVQELNDANHLGYSDWTLPNAKELQSIVDYDRSPDATGSAAIDPIFNVTNITNEEGELDRGFYWTSTTHASARGGQAAVYIAFGRGLGYMNGRYMDVHGAGCQRSDPKSGAAEPTGRGPQGDVVRVDNFVRVVRNIDGSSATSIGESDTPQYSPVVGSGDGDDYARASEEYEAFVLFAPLRQDTAYLINRDGNVVHDWTLSGIPGNSVYLLEGGDLLATYTVRGAFSAGGLGGGVEFLTWDGEEAWSFELANEHAHLHHDVEMLPNGNVLMIAWEAKTREEALAAGLSANQLPASGEVWSEMILEYDPALGRVVWEWHLWDHVLPDGWNPSEHPEKIDLDFFANSRSADWWHFNSINYSAELDQIVISSRAASEVWIIDHALSSTEAAGDAGDLLYRFGNPAAYGGSGEQVLVAQHDAEFISGTADGVRILVFDNGDKRTRPYSRVVELDLHEYENGLFEDATIIWEFGAASGDEHFFADHISGAQRLDSGNTLICSGTEGRFFEVTPAGETVWEYANPFYSTGPDGKRSNEVFRCDAYSADFIGAVLAYADLGEAQVGPSSAPGSAAQNVGEGQQAMSGPGTRRSSPGGPPGIVSVSPSSIAADTRDVAVTIALNPQFSPPSHVRFTSITITTSSAGSPNSQATGLPVADVTATRWTRSGLTVRAWFDIPAQLPRGEHTLTITFPGRDGAPITFSTPIEIR